MTNMESRCWARARSRRLLSRRRSRLAGAPAVAAQCAGFTAGELTVGSGLRFNPNTISLMRSKVFHTCSESSTGLSTLVTEQ